MAPPSPRASSERAELRCCERQEGKGFERRLFLITFALGCYALHPKPSVSLRVRLVAFSPKVVGGEFEDC